MLGAYDHDTTSPTRNESLTKTDSITEYDFNRIRTPAETLQSSLGTPEILTNNSEDTKTPMAGSETSSSAMRFNYLLGRGESMGQVSHWGEWKKEAFDSDGNRLTPFIGLEKFEAHLERCKGFLRPTGRYGATPTWADLLFAFAIRPGMNVITWKPITSGCERDSHDMHLEIEGSVLCHIINLYEYEVTDEGKTIPYDMVPPQGEFDFQFGQIKMATSQGQIEVKFKPAMLQKVMTTLKPFPNRTLFVNSNLKARPGIESCHAWNAIDPPVVQEHLVRSNSKVREPLAKASGRHVQHVILNRTGLNFLPKPRSALIQMWSSQNISAASAMELLVVPTSH